MTMSLATSRQSESARAASAAEARHRIDVPIAPARAARVVALDDRAAQVAARLAAHPWAHAEFLRADAVGELRELGGGPLPLTAALIGADVVVVLATEDGGRDTAERIGRHCFGTGSPPRAWSSARASKPTTPSPRCARTPVSCCSPPMRATSSNCSPP
ncbi:hypothetical protein GCM10017744_004690 [Streptomyces antimycoticus]